MRAKARSPSSKACATRSPSASALSTSSARSASTLSISGWSISRFWKAVRPEHHHSASESAARISPAGAIAVSRRVWCTISMMVRTPAPGSPSAQAKAPAYSISAEALARLPSLSLSRISWMALRAPSGVQRGTRKQVRPAGAWARVRKASDIGAEQNHLCPVSRQPSPPCSARVVLARTSEPPCFSVIAMPTVAPDFSGAGRAAGS